MLEVLLPRTDGGVALQIIGTVILVPSILYLLIGAGRRDVAWLAGGLVAMWIAFAALRTLH